MPDTEQDNTAETHLSHLETSVIESPRVSDLNNGIGVRSPGSASTMNPFITLDCDIDEGGIIVNLSMKALRCLRWIWEQYKKRKAQESDQYSILRTTLDRLVIWTDTVKELCVDNAIRYSGAVFNSILDFLVAISKALISWSSLIDDDPENMSSLEHIVGELQAEVERSEYLLDKASVYVSDNSSDYINSSSPEQKALEEEICSDISCYTSCIMEYIPILEKLAASVNLETGPKIIEPHASDFEGARSFRICITDYFKDASEDIVERMAQTCLQRSSRLLDMVSRKSQVLAEPVTHPATSATAQTTQSESSFYDSGVGTSLPTTSAHSQTTFPTISESISAWKALPKPIPKRSCDTVVTCYICKRTLRLPLSSHEWRSHLRADIKPYICTYLSCFEPHVLYGSFEEWRDHEISHILESSRFQQSEIYSGVSRQHPKGAQVFSSLSNTDKALVLARYLLNTEETCFICQETHSLAQMNEHVRIHQEAVALASIPLSISTACQAIDSDDSGSCVDKSVTPSGNLDDTADKEHITSVQGTDLGIYAARSLKVFKRSSKRGVYYPGA